MNPSEPRVTNAAAAELLTNLAAVPDPRRVKSVVHPLHEIGFVALCGAVAWTEFVAFAKPRLDWFRKFIALERGVPAHDAFGRVFAALDTGRFAGCRRAWTETLATMAPGRVIAIDGKTLCNSFDVATGKQALHLVSAWAAEQRLTLGQVATDAKSNEIEALPRVLDLLDLDGAVVTVGCAGLPDRGQGRRYGVAAPALRRRPR